MNRLSIVLKSMTTVVLSFLSTALAFAEDEPSEDLNLYEGGEFYTQVWFWVIVGLVFILLLLALLRGGKRKE